MPRLQSLRAVILRTQKLVLSLQKFAFQEEEREKQGQNLFGQKTTNEYQFSRLFPDIFVKRCREKNVVIGKITWEKEQLTIKEMPLEKKRNH